MKAADAIVETLVRAGVEKVFGVVGTSTLDVADAIFREPRIEYVSARSEEGAVHMADGYARASGRVAVVLAHVGPGALRQMYGVGTSWKDSVPLVILTGNEVMRATESQMREGYHVIDVLDLYRPITKATIQLRDADDATTAVARALWLAGTGRPGPVLLDLPKSVLKQPFAGPSAPAGTLVSRVPIQRPAPALEDVQAVAESLASARLPVLFVGAGVHTSGAQDALIGLAEAANLPVLTTDGGRGVIPEDHGLALGVLGRQAGDQVARELMTGADVVVAIGTPFSDVSTYEWSAWSDDAVVVQVDIAGEVVHKGVSPERVVLADARAFLDALTEEVGVRGLRCAEDWSARRQQLETERAGYVTEGQERAGSDLVNPWVLIDELDRSLPRDAFISIDSGMHSFYGKKLRVLEPRTYIRSAGFGAMGFSFPAMMGALEAKPDGRAVAIVGDGCMAMGLGEFETAARRGSRVTVVIFNDSRFGSQQSHQHRRFDGRVIGTDFQQTDFAAVARAQGVEGWTATDDDGAREAIRAALELDGPAVVDARLDPDVMPSTWIEGSGDKRLAAASA